MKLICADALLSWKILKESRDLEREEYIDWIADNGSMGAYKYVCCISHRWINIDHPDPDGNQLLEIQSRLLELQKNGMRLHDVLIFFDYACMIQRPRTEEEQIIFERDIVKLD